MKKLAKKMVALVAAMVMVLAMGVTAFAAETGETPETGATTSDYTISITNSVQGETYSVYKVFDASSNGSTIAYKLVSGKTAAPTGFSVDTAGNVTYSGTGTELTATDISAIATYVANDTAVATGTGNGSTLTIDVKEAGYYYITTTTGSVVTVNSANKTASVTDKNTVPSVDKKQSKTEGSYADTDIDVNINDTVYFQTTVTIGKGSDKDITVTDTASTGLTVNTTSIAVKNGQTTLTSGTDYTLTTSGQTFTVVLDDDYVKAHNGGSESVVITYTATVNSSAAINNTTAGAKNSNSVTLTYSKQTSTDTVYETTEDFKLKKTDGTNYLAGAEFKLYSDANATTEVKLAKDDTGYYKAASDATGVAISVDNANGVNIRGLAAGTYYLKETKTPEGYKTAAITTVTVAANQTAEVTVVNTAGTTLPSTGGMGTTIFYVVGAALVIGAGVVLVTRRRVQK